MTKQRLQPLQPQTEIPDKAELSGESKRRSQDWRRLDERLEAELQQTFPASDPLGVTRGFD